MKLTRFEHLPLGTRFRYADGPVSDTIYVMIDKQRHLDGKVDGTICTWSPHLIGKDWTEGLREERQQHLYFDPKEAPDGVIPID